MNSIVQLVSHVAPLSAENACSQSGLSTAALDQVKRTVMGLPRNESSAKNLPTVPSNFPTTGVSRLCGERPSNHQIAHVSVCISYDRNAAALTSPSGKVRTLSSTLPNPPRILRVDDFPENSVQFLQPHRRSLSRLCFTLQSPMMKSKSTGATILDWVCIRVSSGRLTAVGVGPNV